VTQLDIGLDGIIIENVVLILELVEQRFEERATELSYAMERRVNVTDDRISLLNGSSNEVCVSHTHAWDSVVELIWLSSLPNRVLVISAEWIETSKLVPSGTELG